MAENAEPPSLIPISRLAHRYYVYNVDHVSILRREHNIPGILIGTLPQSPQQNTFLGLPLELLPEEARLLVENGVAYIVEDSEHHRKGLVSLGEAGRQTFMRNMRAQGQEVERAAQEVVLAKKEHALGKLPDGKKERLRQAIEDEKQKQHGAPHPVQSNGADDEEDTSEQLFETPPAQPKGSNKIGQAYHSEASADSLKPPPVQERKTYQITPTTSNPPLPTPYPLRRSSLPSVPLHSSYHLFKHLHSQAYFSTSGLRFGAHYSVYPGDPLRFHAHFLARGYDWDQEIDLLSLVGGGRLGTGVKKGYLIGGPVGPTRPDVLGDLNGNESDAQTASGKEQQQEDPEVRCYCVEWAGM